MSAAAEYESVRVDELRVGDRIAARSIGLQQDGDLVVREAYDEPDDPDHQIVLLRFSFVGVDDDRRLAIGEPRSKVVSRAVVERSPVDPRVREQTNGEDVSQADRETARLFGLELLAWQYRLSRGLVARAELGKRDPVDPHPFDVEIDDVRTTAVDAIANVLVYLGVHHGEQIYLDDVIQSARDHARAEIRS